jgi:ankyrin repeat protein
MLVALPSVWIQRQYRQIIMDRALIAAIVRSDADAVDALLAEGANPNTRESDSRKPSLQVLNELLRMVPVDRSFLVSVVSFELNQHNGRLPQDSLHIVESLLSKGADVDSRDQYGNTALIYASGSGDLDTVKMLIAAYANVNAKGKSGHTALMWACMVSADTTVKALLAAHADVNPVSNDGFTALKYAKIGQEHNIVALLMAAGAKE